MNITPGFQLSFQNHDQVVQHLTSFTPGRVNLIGEHTDYNGGMVMPAALDFGLKADLWLVNDGLEGVWIASASTNETLQLSTTHISEIARELLTTGIERSDKVLLDERMARSWARYVLGCFALFEAALTARRHNRMPWHGSHLHIRLDANLPHGAGLSSSAALCVSLLCQLNILSGVPLDAGTLARLAMYVEHRFAGTKCGLMDQLAVLCSRPGHFTQIDFADFPISRTFKLSYAKAHDAFREYALVIFRTGVSHSLADSEYNLRRASCETALNALNRKLATQAHSLGELARLSHFTQLGSTGEFLADLQRLLEGEKGFTELAKRACHAMLENRRVEAAARALAAGDRQTLNLAMRESHASLDSLYEVTCPELNLACSAVQHVVEEICNAKQLSQDLPLIGPRMTGGGFGGSTVQLIHSSICAEVQERFAQPNNPYTQATGIKPQLFVSHPSAGFTASFEPLS